MSKISKSLLVAAAVCLAAPALAQGNIERAQRNYFDVMAGRKQLHQLTPTELEEVRLLDAAKRGLEPHKLDTKSECLEREKRSDTPSTLEDSILDLKCSQRPT